MGRRVNSLLRLVRWGLLVCLAAACLWLLAKMLLVPQADHAWRQEPHETINDITDDGQWVLVSTVPNGNRVVRRNNRVYIRHANTGALHRELILPLKQNEISYLKLSPDGKTVSLVQESHQCILYLESGQMASFKSFHRNVDGSYSLNYAQMVTWSHDSKRAAIITPDELILWDTAKHQALMTTSRKHEIPYLSLSNGVYSSPRSDFLVSNYHGSYGIWNASTGRNITTFEIIDNPVVDGYPIVTTLYFPDDQTVAIYYSNDGMHLECYRLATGAQIETPASWLEMLKKEHFATTPRMSCQVMIMRGIGQGLGYQLADADGGLAGTEQRFESLSAQYSQMDHWIQVTGDRHQVIEWWNDLANTITWFKLPRLSSRQKTLHLWKLPEKTLLIDIAFKNDFRSFVSPHGNRLIIQEGDSVRVFDLPARTALPWFAIVCIAFGAILLWQLRLALTVPSRSVQALSGGPMPLQSTTT
jgi:hypothetical protein